jgi:hypothetical protein
MPLFSAALLLLFASGRTFVKVGHPHNAIIMPPPGNTTAPHDMGEGDHCSRFCSFLLPSLHCLVLPPLLLTLSANIVAPPSVIVKDGYYYLYFLEWDGPGSRMTVAVARAEASTGGRPGSWFKWHKVRRWGGCPFPSFFFYPHVSCPLTHAVQCRARSSSRESAANRPSFRA